MSAHPRVGVPTSLFLRGVVTLSKLTDIKSASSLTDLARLLGFKPSAVSYLLYKIPPNQKYSIFTIPKRNGGVRKIAAPEERLRHLQRSLSDLLYSCLTEIETASAKRKPLSHGFQKSLSIISNAEPHRRKRYVFNIDLEDFFPSINFGRVRGFFIRDRNFQLQPKVATVLAQIACYDNTLPQGSPCSPVISNLIGNLLDVRLVALAKKNHCKYTRYVDDITFSTNQSDFPTDIAVSDAKARGRWAVGKRLEHEINRAGFKVNRSKTRMQIRGSRQVATGLVVNEKVNVPSEYYRTIRSMCAQLFSTAQYYRVIPASLAGGLPTDPAVKVNTSSLQPLEGMLSYVYYIRDSADRRTATEKKKLPTATRKLYQHFLHYKNFVALDRPLIVTEGRTDSIYLKAAIERLTKFQPALGSRLNSGKFSLTIRFLKYGPRVTDVLQLGGGTGDLKYLVLRHRDLVSRYHGTRLKYPVIIVIDNDDGANTLFSVAAECGVKNINHASTNEFFKIFENLYLVKTPSLRGKQKTCIEDLFAPDTLAIKLQGKSFDPNKEHGDETTYGKVRFAERVIKPHKESVNFTGFAPLLQRITNAIDDYKP